MSKLLIADDNVEMLDTLERIFALYDFRVIKATNGLDAVDLAEKETPDLIILDGMMPEMDGFEACQILKKKSSTGDIPVIFLTANFVELQDRIKGLELGADDYLLKPFNSRELVARIKSILKRTEATHELKQANLGLIKRNELIEKELNEFIQNRVDSKELTDPLTGLLEFEYFKERVNTEIIRSRRYNNDLSFILISFENFEKISETLGTNLFNYLVIKLSNIILKESRIIDVMAFDRKKGFFLLLPQTDHKGAIIKIRKINDMLNNKQFIDDEILKSPEFSRRKISDISNLNFVYGSTCLNNLSTETLDSLFAEVNRSASENTIRDILSKE